MTRRLWIDTKGQPVITTTPNGISNATRWGWTPAVAVASEQANREPSDAAVEAAARAMAHADVTNPDGWVMTEEARNVYSDMARAALIAAQEVRRG